MSKTNRYSAPRSENLDSGDWNLASKNIFTEVEFYLNLKLFSENPEKCVICRFRFSAIIPESAEMEVSWT